MLQVHFTVGLGYRIRISLDDTLNSNINVSKALSQPVGLFTAFFSYEFAEDRNAIHFSGNLGAINSEYFFPSETLNHDVADKGVLILPPGTPRVKIIRNFSNSYYIEVKYKGRYFIFQTFRNNALDIRESRFSTSCRGYCFVFAMILLIGAIIGLIFGLVSVDFGEESDSKAVALYGTGIGICALLIVAVILFNCFERLPLVSLRVKEKHGRIHREVTDFMKIVGSRLEIERRRDINFNP